MAALIGLDSTSSGFDPGLQDPPITFGVWGDSGDADGVIGSSNAGVGVFGRSIAAGATAVRGSSQDGTGVQATSVGGSAVHARRDPGGGAAVTEAFLATPSLAADFRGDVATSGALRVGGRLDAAGVVGSSNTGVGVFGRSVAAAASAVQGASQNGTGVDATSVGGTALHARRDPGGGAAVTEAFLATPSLAADFRGDVATSGALRVGGRLDAAGVVGSSNTGVGVFGRSVAAAASAVQGASEKGTGVDATSASGTALHARRDPGGGAAVTEAFLATPSLAADFRGDVATSGALSVGGRLGIGIGAQTGPAAKLHVNGAEEGIRVQGPATGNANVAYVSFVDSAGTEIGYVGDASHTDQNVYLSADRGDVVLVSAGRDVLTATSSGVVSIGHLTASDGLDVTGGFLNVTATPGPFAPAIRGTGSIGVVAEGVIGISAGATPGGTFAGLFRGDVNITGTLRKGVGQFQIDHPLDPANKLLYHSGIESDEMKNLYDGVAELDADGGADVVLPDWFEALNENFRYQLTPIGAAAPELHIGGELRNGRFTIAGGRPNMKVCWLVSGVRHDAYAQAHPMQVEMLKSPEEAGRFVHPEEHNEPAERSLVTFLSQSPNDSRHG